MHYSPAMEGINGELDVGVTSGIALLILLIIIITKVLRRERKQPKVPPDTVCLYQVGRGPLAPSLSSYPLKLETFLRMVKIPYMNDHSAQMSKKGKTPWMTYNGQAVADSQFCLEFLKRERNIDVDSHLTKEEKAAARAIRALTEENLYWTMCYETFVKVPQSLDVLLKNIFPRLKTIMFKLVVGRVIRLELWGQGIGRHTDSEIWDIARRDMVALSDFLGKKSFFMGKEPSEIDCAVFGMLAMIRWHMKGSRHERFMLDELPNLTAFCERMKDKFWPDWEKRCKELKFVDDHHKLYTFE